MKTGKITILILLVISVSLLFTHIYFSKMEKVVDEGNKINYKIESDDVGKKALSILTINGKEVSDRIKGGFYDLEIEEKDDFLIVNTVREELCSNSITKDYGNIYIFDYKGHLLYKSTDHDMQLAKLTYDGNYVYNANEKSIVLNYHITCNGLSCNICNQVDSKTEITYDTFSKAKFKISFANGSFKSREIIESTLISDDEGYSKDCKSFASEECNYKNNEKDDYEMLLRDINSDSIVK